MKRNSQTDGTLRNNPFRFKFDREPANLVHCFAMALERIDEQFPYLVIERRALDKVLFGKELDSMKQYRQYPFVMKGGKWNTDFENHLISYFVICWLLRKLDPSDFPMKALRVAYETYVERKLSSL